MITVILILLPICCILLALSLFAALKQIEKLEARIKRLENTLLRRE